MLEGIIRESTSKQATKQLRRDGYLIANIYGEGTENISAAFNRNDFIRYVKNKDSLKFDVSIGGKVIPVMIHEYQRDPLSGEFLHVDLRALSGTKASTFLVPVKTSGIPKGLKNKGVLVMNQRRLKIKCKPADLPDSFTVDVTNLDTGDSLMIRDLDVPANVAIVSAGRISVVSVIKAK
jgi:large subunit ribosomal protein L25